MYIALGVGGITPLVGTGNLPYIWLYGDSFLPSESVITVQEIYYYKFITAAKQTTSD